MTTIQTRRRLLAGLSGIGAAALLSTPSRALAQARAGDSVRLPKNQSHLWRYRHILSADLLRAKGSPISATCHSHQISTRPTRSHAVWYDFGQNFGSVQVVDIDRGAAIKVLTGLHIGCFELFAADRIRGVADLAGKKVGIPAVGSPEHLFLSVIAANVGIDPKAQIDWVTGGPVRPEQLLIDGKLDAFLGVSARAAGAARPWFRSRRGPQRRRSSVVAIFLLHAGRQHAVRRKSPDRDQARGSRCP